jgi:hypothetical protein
LATLTARAFARSVAGACTATKTTDAVRAPLQGQARPWSDPRSFVLRVRPLRSKYGW